MRLPDTLEPFRKEAETLLSCGQPEEIIFSGPTYQIRFTENGETLWVFLQLDDQGDIQDLFCQREACVTTPACHHMVAAYLSVFKNSSTPLHERFERSAFFCLLSPLAQLPKISVQKKDSVLYIAKSIIINGSQKWLEIIEELLKAETETEETSIKFSNISPHELENWRRGSLSPTLRFELSPISDLAKKLFCLNEIEPCSFHFEENGKVPQYIRCCWKNLECRLPCPKDFAELLEVLPPTHTFPHLEPYGGKRV
jgi:hypothetical protein